MKPASFGPFQPITGSGASGALLHVSAKPRSGTRTLRTADGWRCTLIDGQPIAMVSSSIDSGESTKRECNRALNRALDILSVRNKEQLTPVGIDQSEEAIYWHNCNGQTTLQITCQFNLVMTSNAVLTVRNSDGGVQPSTVEPPAEWHPSYSYFRRSQVTDDLFDAYRNMYLALEALLSEVDSPMSMADGKLENDKKWFLRTLQTAAGEEIHLDDFTCDNHGGNPASRVYRDFYDRVRVATFHAKLTRSPLVPGDSDAHDVVQDSLRRLGRLYVRLANKVLGASFGGTRVNSKALARNTIDLMRGSTMYLTTDDSDINKTDAVSPKGHPTHEMQLDRIVEDGHDGALGVWSVSANMTGIRRIAARVIYPGDSIHLVGVRRRPQRRHRDSRRRHLQ